MQTPIANSGTVLLCLERASPSRRHRGSGPAVVELSAPWTAGVRRPYSLSIGDIRSGSATLRRYDVDDHIASLLSVDADRPEHSSSERSPIEFLDGNRLD